MLMNKATQCYYKRVLADSASPKVDVELCRSERSMSVQGHKATMTSVAPDLIAIPAATRDGQVPPCMFRCPARDSDPSKGLQGLEPEKQK